jgi:leucyl aminopeptidase (aminopeptidase T)
VATIESTILGQSLGLTQQERLTVLTDEQGLGRALAFHREACRLGAESVVLLQVPQVVGNELAAVAAAAFGESDVIVSVLAGSISHSGVTREALARGARVVSMGASTEEMLKRLLCRDASLVVARSRRIAAALSAARRARITCPLGTDLALDVEGRTGVADDGDLGRPGSLGNMPFGEGYIAPNGGAGRVVPTTIAGQGRLRRGPVLEVENGRLLSAQGAAGRTLCETLDRHGAAGRSLAELGIGAHHAARLSGNVLEDEKVLGSAHVAFGSNAAFGGNVDVPVHIDCVVADATIWLDDRVFDPAGAGA